MAQMNFAPYTEPITLVRYGRARALRCLSVEDFDKELKEGNVRSLRRGKSVMVVLEDIFKQNRLELRQSRIDERAAELEKRALFTEKCRAAAKRAQPKPFTKRADFLAKQAEERLQRESHSNASGDAEAMAAST